MYFITRHNQKNKTLVHSTIKFFIFIDNKANMFSLKSKSQSLEI